MKMTVNILPQLGPWGLFCWRFKRRALGLGSLALLRNQERKVNSVSVSLRRRHFTKLPSGLGLVLVKVFPVMSSDQGHASHYQGACNTRGSYQRLAYDGVSQYTVTTAGCCGAVVCRGR